MIRARLLQRDDEGATLEVTVRVNVVDDGDGQPAFVFVDGAELPEAATQDPLVILDVRAGMYTVVPECSGLQWSDNDAATRALLTAVCDAINAALAGANAKGGAA